LEGGDENIMSTRDTIKSYYNSLKQKEGWESFLADEMTFINNGKQLKGKDAALEGFGRFFSMVQSLEVKELLIEDEKASAVIRYALQSPNGKTFSSDVAEFITLNNGKFVSFAIYFDTAPYS
jgi:ketosteroid isomerase-like protein